MILIPVVDLIILKIYVLLNVLVRELFKLVPIVCLLKVISSFLPEFRIRIDVQLYISCHILAQIILILLLDTNYFLPLSWVNMRQVIWKDLVLPVGHHSIPFVLLNSPVLIFDVHSRVVLEITHTKFAESLCERIFP